MSIEATSIAHELLEAPPAERDPLWISRFFKCLPRAAFKLDRERPVVSGADGFSYLNLRVPDEGEKYSATSLAENLAQLLSRGYGVVFNAHKGDRAFGLSYGHLWPYKEFGAFKVQVGASDELKTGPYKEVSNDGTSLFYGDPNEMKLPKYVRRHLRSYLSTSYGIERPGILLLINPNERPHEGLIFSFTDSDFEDASAYEQCMSGVRWFLPEEYSTGTFLADAQVKFEFFPL